MRDLLNRRSTVVSSIAEQRRLTGELTARMEATLDRRELEDLDLRDKPRRRATAPSARACSP